MERNHLTVSNLSTGIPEPPADRTLLLVHGFGGVSTQFEDFFTNPDLREFYNNIIAIDYYEYHDFLGNGLKKGFDKNTPIEDIGDAIAEYILNNPTKFYKTLDIVAYSLGGLVIRSMILRHYPRLVKNGYRIDDVALIATPNRGTHLSNPPIFLAIMMIIAGVLLGLFFSLNPFYTILLAFTLSLIPLAFFIFWRKLFGYQGAQLVPSSSSESDSFLHNLSEYDETPYGIEDLNEIYRDISWSTFFGKGYHPAHFISLLINPLTLRCSDGFVPCYSVPIKGAVNYGPYNLNHDELIQINSPKSALLFADLFRELTTLRKAD